MPLEALVSRGFLFSGLYRFETGDSFFGIISGEFGKRGIDI
jgi:hypothetical protein